MKSQEHIISQKSLKYFDFFNKPSQAVSKKQQMQENLILLGLCISLLLMASFIFYSDQKKRDQEKALLENLNKIDLSVDEKTVKENVMKQTGLTPEFIYKDSHVLRPAGEIDFNLKLNDMPVKVVFGERINVLNIEFENLTQNETSRLEKEIMGFKVGHPELSFFENPIIKISEDDPNKHNIEFSYIPAKVYENSHKNDISQDKVEEFNNQIKELNKMAQKMTQAQEKNNTIENTEKKNPLNEITNTDKLTPEEKQALMKTLIQMTKAM